VLGKVGFVGLAWKAGFDINGAEVVEGWTGM
jgi:hypothetical protein